MPTIIDDQGEREVSDAELARLNAEDDAAFDAFWGALVWRPIAEWDIAGLDLALLRAEGQWAIGYRDPSFDADEDSVAWRNAQESMEGGALTFEPTEFAEVDDEWRGRLMAD